MEAERRQVTVLFADMVGFTTFSERSGEEAAYTLMQRLSKLMGGCLSRARGALSRPLQATALWRSLERLSRLRMRPLRACRAAAAKSCNVSKRAGPDLEGEARHTAADAYWPQHWCGRGRQGPRTVRTPELRFWVIQ